MDIFERMEGLEPIYLEDFDIDKTVIFVFNMSNGFVKIDGMEDISEPIVTFCKDCDYLKYNIIPYIKEGDSLIDGLDFIKEKTVTINATNPFFNMNPDYLDDSMNYIILGAFTDVSVYQFAITLESYIAERGYSSKVTVPANMVATYDTNEHDARFYNSVFLSSLMDNGINVVKDIL